MKTSLIQCIATICLQWNSKAKMISLVEIATRRLFSKLGSIGAAASGDNKGLSQMMNVLTRAAKLSAWLAAVTLVSAAPALSQAPTQAQRDAIKSQCRNDYIAHCSSVPPGGEASLQCLQKNMASLGSACASAVRAVEAPAAAAAP
ncbi:hypothetical protein H8A99_25585, partial [Bradyrhizobium sp. Arg68]|nr:hypothetical protein [Bradyrhizobium ivorense]